MKEFADKRIAVIGLGGVGGYIGALLARAYPHVSFVARGARRASIEEKGLTLHSEYSGEYVVRPEKTVESGAELESQDYIFICVKNYSLEEVCGSLKNCVAEDTVIIPVMNGVDPGERTRAYLPRGTVIDCLIYTIGFANPDYSITQQGPFTDLHIGARSADGAEKEKILAVSRLLGGAGIDCVVEEDIQAAIWKKYILNCAYNVETAFYDNTIGELRRDPRKAAEYEALVEEALQVALAKGVRVSRKDGERIIDQFRRKLAEGATSSLQRDLAAGRRTELETFSGYIVREAARLQVPAPVSARMYEGLKNRCAAAQQKMGHAPACQKIK